MRTILLLLPITLLAAAACNASKPQSQLSPAPTSKVQSEASTNPVPTPPVSNGQSSSQSYVNSQYDYQVKHPPGWTIVDSSFSYKGRNIIAFRLLSPQTTAIAQSNGEPVKFDMLVCQNSDQAFTDLCWQNYGEVISFDFPHRPNNQALNSVDMPVELIKASPEYSVAQEILNTVHQLQMP